MLSFMAVVKPTMNKVRPVLDFHELNEYVSCDMGDEATNVYRFGGVGREQLQASSISSRPICNSMYPKELWKHRLVRYRSRTRLRFSLSSAPKSIGKGPEDDLG